MHGAGRSLLAFAAAVLIASSLADHSTTQVVQKNMAEFTNPEDTKLRHAEFDLDKYQDMRESTKHLRVPDDYLDILLSKQLNKRASMRGFQGMRGKKTEYEIPTFYGAHSHEPIYNDINYYHDKRGPVGFQGMRGKKSLEEVLDELEKRSKTGFQALRGKKSEDYEDLPQDAGEYRKRAPMGFQGMRGRKSSFLDELDELEKRALLGFHGMRGKKDMQYEREELPIDFDGYVEKRPMMMGFHGMRGKRNTNYYGSRYEKRSPYQRFYLGNRGKKNPLWEIRGKFVGVRGKKWTEAPNGRLPGRLHQELREPSQH